MLVSPPSHCPMQTDLSDESFCCNLPAMVCVLSACMHASRPALRQLSSLNIVVLDTSIYASHSGFRSCPPVMHRFCLLLAV